jgi:hypothetical protein
VTAETRDPIAEAEADLARLEAAAAPAAPWGPMDPNSQHQRWSRWIFGIQATPQKRPAVLEVVDNARRYFTARFHSAGQVRCDEQDGYYCLVLEIEGPDAHDPEVVARVQADFTQRFMAPGFGQGATLVRFTVGLLAGDAEDGRPPAQLLVMPSIRLTDHLTPEELSTLTRRFR